MAGIHNAILKVMKDVGAVGKDDKNPQQGYKYRGIDAVMNALQPALIKNGVYVVPTVLEHEREERETKNGSLLIYTILKVRYTFYAEDGTSIECVVTGEGMDSGDKSANKAMSSAFKYACFQTFCIPTEEMIDSETESPEPMPKKSNKRTTKEIDRIGVDQAEAIKSILEETSSDTKRFLQNFGVASVEEITIEDYPKAQRLLQAKLEQKEREMNE